MIKINELELQEASCVFSNFTLQLDFNIEDITLQELESYFSINEEAFIEQYENDILINKWYYKEFQSIAYEKFENGWHIKIFLNVLPASSTDLSRIYTLIQEEEDAILEIASLIDGNDTQNANFSQSIKEVNAKIEQLRTTIERNISSLQSTIYSINNNYTQLANRVARLEANIGEEEE